MNAQPAAFVLMPFDSEFLPIFEDLIKRPLEEVGYSVRRADSMLDQQNILRDIVKGIYEADLVVADLTGLNPNVLYELGVCHGLNIPSVLITQNIEEVPFDLRAYRLQVYSVLFNEAGHLPATLKNIAEAHLAGKIKFGSPVSDFLRQPPPVSPGRKPLRLDSIEEPADGEGQQAGPPEEEGLEEPGWLDLIAERDQVLEELGATYSLLSESISKMGAEIRGYAAQVVDIADNPGPGASRRAHLVMSKAARTLDGHSSDIETLLPTLAPQSMRLVELLAQPSLLAVGADDKRKREERAGSLEGLLESNQSALEGVRYLRGTVVGLRERGFSRELNRSCARLRLGLDKVIENMEIVESGLARVIDILEQDD